MVTHCLHAMLLAAASGKRPTRDLIFAAVSDEEAGCTHGSRFLVDEHPELVRAEYMLGEFGGFSLDVNDVRYYPIQVAEKGVCQFRLTAHGEPGHGSIPHDENAVVRLAEAVAKLGRTRLPQKRTATVETFLQEMARHQKPPARQVLPLLLRPQLSDFVLRRLVPDRSTAHSMAANLSNTVSPTMLDAGAHRNVIPSSASAVLDGRLLPGQTRDDLFREVTDVIGPGFDFEVISYAEGRETLGFESDPLYRAIVDNVRATDPAGVPLPYMLTGFTDAREFGRLGMKCFGYAPVRFPAEDEIKFQKLVHGHDERIHVDGFLWGVSSFWRLIQTFTGLPAGR
jgi:acetylornithine deacetylase/succinyl-diaminopimelate desuccinylase-like protein